MTTTTSPYNVIVPFGTPKKSSIYVSGSKYTANAVNYKYTKRLSQPGDFSLELWGLSGNDFNVVNQNKPVMFFDENLLQFRGIIERIEPGTDGVTNIYGTSSTSSILKRRIFGVRNSYIGSSIPNIFLNMLSANLDGMAPFIVATGVMLNLSGSPSVNAEFDNRLSPVETLCNTVGIDWWESYSGPTYSVDMLNIGSFRGNTKSQYTFNTGGSLQNCSDFTRVNEQQSQVNRVIVLGYGDGVNQISGVAIDLNSMAVNGSFERVFHDSSISDPGWAGSMAQDILNRYSNPPLRGNLVVPGLFLKTGSQFDVGDVVTLNDKPTNMSGSTFRILALTRCFDPNKGDEATLDIFQF